MMFQPSIRLRLTLWYSAVLLAGLAAFGGAMWYALDSRLMSAVETRLEQRVDGLRTVVDTEAVENPTLLREEVTEFAREVPEGGLMQVRNAQGKDFIILPGQPAFQSGPAGFSTESLGGRSYRVLRTRIQAGGQPYDILVASSLDSDRAVLRDFRRLLLLMVPAILLLACVGGYWISRRALSPVDEITRVAGSISVQNLSRRLTVRHTGDELERMSETWNQVLERLDSAVRSIRQFTADASHELRTPIALMRATAELALRRERSPAEYRKSLDDIRIEAERMTELTEALLTLARSDFNGIPLTLASTDLNEVVVDVVNRNRDSAASKDVAVFAQTMDSPAVVAVDREAIRRLLLALVDNAVKYTPAGGTVTVSTLVAEGGVRVTVKDTGEGIGADALPHIFDRFYREDTARTKPGGAGLGLSIAQAIAEAHGSRIVVESAPGEGSRFELVLSAERGR